MGNVVHRSEILELQLFNTLNNSKNTSLRSAAILKVMREERSTTALINPYLAIRYQIQREVTLELLEAARLKIKLT